MNNPIKVLVTGAGALLGQGILRALRASSLNTYIIAADPSPLSAGLYWTDSAHLLPLATDPRYLPAVEELIAREKPDVILIGTDVELAIFAQHRERLEREFGTHIIVSSPEVVAIADDKWKTFEFFRANGFDCPESCLPGGEDVLVEKVGFPLVVKPRVGARSIGVELVRDREELRRALASAPGLIVQECVGCAQTEYTAGALYFDGACRASIVMRRELRDGNTYRAYAEKESELNETVTQWTERLKPYGPVNFQFRIADGRPKVFEINGRFSGTTGLRYHAGFNSVEMAIRRVVLGEAIVQPKIKPVVILRHWSETVLAPDQLLDRRKSATSAATAPALAKPAVNGEFRVLGTAEETEWMKLLRRTRQYDFHHLPQYHRVAEERGEGTARLFTYREGEYVLALPLVLRPVDAAEPAGWQDATSVYGYGGPVASHDDMPSETIGRFHVALLGALVQERVISVFSRLHPLIPQIPLLGNLGECRPHGHTVSIDLTQPAEEQWYAYRKQARRCVKKLKQLGFVGLHDTEMRYFSEFVSIYRETMERVGAHDCYLFDEAYFRLLARELGSRLHLFVALQGGTVAAASLATIEDGIVQDHLGGTRGEFLALSPDRLVVDTERQWAMEHGAHTLHVGGGLGSSDDSLFHYKAGFSDRRHEFTTWRWIINEKVYRELCDLRREANAHHGLEPVSEDYFPAYRCPAVRPLPASTLRAVSAPASLCTVPGNGRAPETRKHARPANGNAPAANASRIFLSPPHMGGAELELVKEAFATNWIAPLGPHVDAFEKEFARYIGVSHAAALSSGTAAIHLVLRLLGVGRGDEVLCSTFTFSASANPIMYEGATPVFIDSEPQSWNMDPELLREELEACAKRGRLPRAVVVVDLYGQSADYARITAICDRYGVPIVQDAAEALGATCGGRRVGIQGRCGVFSFNGNKIITTSGGGMLVSEDRELIERARFLATQARDPAPHYQHSAVGFNYRMSNVLAGIGRGQLMALPERIAARRRNFQRYRAILGETPGIGFMPIGAHGEANYWLTCITIDPEKFGATREDVRLALEAQNIESRPVWKPLHLQPVFAGCRARRSGVAEAAFAHGLCLPSGSALTEADLQRICSVVLATQKAPAGNLV